MVNNVCNPSKQCVDHVVLDNFTFLRCRNYFCIYVSLCICSYMHIVELWPTTIKHTMVYHMYCHRLPWYIMLASLVNGILFMLSSELCTQT